MATPQRPPPRLQSTMPTGGLSLQALLRHAAQVHGDREIVTCHPNGDRRTGSYLSLYQRSLRLAAGLRNAGLRKGDGVATLMWNHAAHLEAHFGVTLAGGVLVPLNVRLHPKELAELIRRAEARHFFVDDVLMPLFESIPADGNGRRAWTYAFDGDGETGDAYARLLDGAPLEEKEPPESPETDPAVACFTSGTTGRPKCVVYSHRSLVLHSLATALPDAFDLSHQDVVATVAPLFHISGWALPFGATLVGAKQVLPGATTEPKALLDILAAEAVTFTAAVPTVWHGVLAALEAEPDRWRLAPNLRIMTGGSAPSEALIAGLMRHGIAVVHTWGMTETTAAATVSKSTADARAGTDDATRTARQGRPIPVLQMRLRRDGHEVPRDGKSGGELQIKGPWVANSYHGKNEGNDPFTEDGWLRTGDIAVCDSDGAVRLIDREKDLIKSGGEWISSLALENALMGHGGIEMAAVVAYPHPKWQERPVAFLVAKSGASVDPAELYALLARRFARWSIPDAFEFVDALPRASSGKIDRAALRKLVRGLQVAQRARAGSLEAEDRQRPPAAVTADGGTQKTDTTDRGTG